MEAQTLSKNQQKRLRRKEIWEAGREERKRKQKEKRKAKREADKLKRAEEGENAEPKKNAVIKPKDQINSGVSVIIDLGFNEYMLEKEIKSMCKQIRMCYTANRRCVHPVELRCVGYSGVLKERMEAVKWGHENWNVKFEETPLEGLKDSFDNMIYLTAEAEDSLQSFEEGKTYIIGGIVDKNRHKGICYDKAKRLGLKMAKLPITEYIKLLSRQVLTVNQVVEIICKQLETKNWEAALNEVVPQRKLIKENEQQPSESITPESSE